MITDEKLIELGVPKNRIPGLRTFLKYKGVIGLKHDKLFYAPDITTAFTVEEILEEFSESGLEINASLLCRYEIPAGHQIPMLKFIKDKGFDYHKNGTLWSEDDGINAICHKSFHDIREEYYSTCKNKKKEEPNGAEHPYKNLSMREFACLKLRLPESGTPWLDELIQHHRTKKQVENSKFYSKLDQVPFVKTVDSSYEGSTTSIGMTDPNIIPEPSPVETHTTSLPSFTRYFVTDEGKISHKQHFPGYHGDFGKNTFASAKLAMKAYAISFLSDVLEFENKGWEPDWNNPDQIKIVITVSNNRICIGSTIHKNHFLAFEEIEKAQRVFVSFRNEILDYYMVDEKDRQQ